MFFRGITPVLSIDSASDGGIAPIPEPSTFALSLAGLGAIGIPEPSSYALMLAGLDALGLWAQRKRAASASR